MRRTGLLQWKAYRTLEAFHNPILAKYRTTHTEWKLLELVHDEGELRVTEIAGKLAVRTPLITRTLKTLLYKKNIVIGKHSRDRRVKCVDITVKGKKRLAQIEKDIQKILGRILRGIPSKKIEVYKEVLTGIVRNGKSLGKKPS
ncbi:MAG: MarR family transcriptional regulator [Candidatus Moranbacteria bacterium]|nr:MarR family transcriptional regulator [Candidatus Moranbacteria bacterium]